MALLLVVDAEELQQRMWYSVISREERKFFDLTCNAAAAHTIVLVRGPKYDRIKRQLSVQPKACECLTSGQSDGVLFVEKSDEIVDSDVFALSMPNESSEQDSVRPTSFQNFLDECRNHELPADLVQACEELLAAANSEQPFVLNEGEQRKWTAKPNFVALTIQNRNKQILVSVKGEPTTMSYSKISPKVSRPPYCEFHFESASQLEEVIDVVRKSIRY